MPIINPDGSTPVKPKGPTKRTQEAREMAAAIFFGQKDKVEEALARLFKEKKFDKFLTHWEKIGAMFLPAIAAVQLENKSEQKITIESSLAQLSALVPNPTVPIEDADIEESPSQESPTSDTSSTPASSSTPLTAAAKPKKKTTKKPTK